MSTGFIKYNVPQNFLLLATFSPQADSTGSRGLPPHTGSMRQTGSMGHHSDDVVTRMKNIEAVELGRLTVHATQDGVV